DFGTEDEPTTSQGLQEIENQRSNESCPDVDNAPTTSNNQILVTDSVMQNEDNEAANRLVCDALKGTTKKEHQELGNCIQNLQTLEKKQKAKKKLKSSVLNQHALHLAKKNVERNFQNAYKLVPYLVIIRSNIFGESERKFEVCKIFFLTTLGYNKKNDRRILDAIKKPWNAQTDKRGKREHKEKIDRNQLKEHIESFRPAIAHYRRKHAPNKRYLPSDLNATLMFKDFQDKFPDIKVSYELYRHFLKKDMNISFTLLGNEECEDCESFKLHQPTCQDSASCDTCISYKLHKQKYEKARKCYQEDVDLSTKFTEKAFYSADLQKVIMLPRIDMFKAAIFVPE
ncbi:hypothetical protein HF086_008070, partial [Spodoptera exigua]